MTAPTIPNVNSPLGIVLIDPATGLPYNAAGGVGISAGTQSVNTGTVVFSNSNGVSFGLSNGVLTAQAAATATAGLNGILAGTQTASSGSVSFLNSNGVTFGMSNSSQITASVASQSSLSFSNANGVSFGTAGSTLTASVAAQSALSFSNANGITFGTAASTLTASYNSTQFAGLGTTFAGTNASASMTLNSAGLNMALSAAAGAGGGLDLQIGGNTSGTTALVSTGTLTLAGGNNITLSQVGNAITISGANAGGAQTGISGFQVSNTTYTSGTITLQNANGISFGSSGANGISASYTVPTQSNQSIGVYGVSQSTGQSSSSTYDARSLSFAGYGIISVGQSAGTIQISAPGTTGLSQMSLGISGGNTSGNTGTVAQGQVVLAGGNNVTLSGSTNGSSMTITISAGTASGNPVNFSAGTTSGNLGSVVFSNSNSVSFGLNGSTITASVPNFNTGNLGTATAQTNVTWTANSAGLSFNAAGYAGSGTTFAGTNASASMTLNSAGLNLALSAAAGGGGGGVNFGVSTAGNTAGATGTVSTGNVVLVGLGPISLSQATGAAGSAATISINAPATSSLVGTNGVSVSVNGSTISVSQLSPAIYLSSNTTAQSSSSAYPPPNLTMVGMGNVSLGWSTNGLVISGATVAGQPVNFSAGTTSNNLGSVVFSNSNGVSFGMNVSTVTGSVAAQTNQTIGLYGVGNTTQNSSTTLDARTLSFNGLGGATVGFSNGTVQLSAPVVSSLVGTNGISLSSNGSTISISGLANQRSFYQAWPFDNSTVSQQGNGSIFVYPANGAPAFSASRADIMVSVSLTSLAVSTEAQAMSLFIGLYSLNGSTLSMASSGSQSYAWTNSSAASNASISGLRRFSVPINVNDIGVNDLFIAMMSSTTFSNTQGVTLNNVVVPQGPGIQLAGLIGQDTNNSYQFVPGQGVYSVTSAGLPSSMAFSQISGIGSGAAAANFSPVQFANVSA